MKETDELIGKIFSFTDKEFMIRETKKKYSREKLYLQNLTENIFVSTLYEKKSYPKKRTFQYNVVNTEEGKKYHYYLNYDEKKDFFWVVFSHKEKITEELRNKIQSKKINREEYRRRMNEVYDRM